MREGKERVGGFCFGLEKFGGSSPSLSSSSVFLASSSICQKESLGLHLDEIGWFPYEGLQKTKGEKGFCTCGCTAVGYGGE